MMRSLGRTNLVALALLQAATLAGQNVAQVNAGARQDLDAAVRQLAVQRQAVAQEKVQLSREANQAKKAAADQRRELERIQRRKDNAGLEIQKLQEVNKQLEEDLAYVSSLFLDYASEFDATIDIAEKANYKDDLAQLHSAAGGEAPTVEEFAAEFRFLQTALDRLGKVTGGHQFQSASILGPDGSVENGTCLLVGPFSFFANEKHAGIVQTDPGPPLRPKVRPLDKSQAALIRDYALHGKGPLPIDPTQNDALQIQTAKRTFIQEVQAGGVWIWPILLFALASLVGAGVKLVEVFTIHNPPAQTLEAVLEKVQSGDADAARSLAAEVKGPFRPLLENAIQFAHSRKVLLEEVLFEKILEAQPRLERFLPFIAVTAAASPLLGLLGTVTGMISTFSQIRISGNSDINSLASGISEALVTTKFGLIAAIPALVLHALLSRRVQGLLAGMEKFSTAFVNGMERDRE